MHKLNIYSIKRVLFILPRYGTNALSKFSPDTELVLYPLQDKLTSGDKSLDLSAFKLSRLFFSLMSSGFSSCWRSYEAQLRLSIERSVGNEWPNNLPIFERSVFKSYDPFPSTDETEQRPLCEFLIKFLVFNGQRPLTFDFNTFCSSIGLDYNNGKYVAHPALEVLGGNYSSTEQVNSIQHLLAYCLIIGTKVDIGDIIYMSPLPLTAKPKKGKSHIVTQTLPKSQGPEASGALSKKRKKPKSKKPPTETKVTTPKPTDSSEQSHSVSSGTVPDPQDLERNIQLASTGLPSTLDEGTRKSQPLPEGTATHPKDSGGNIQPLDRDLTSMTSDEGTAKTTPRPEGSLGDKDSGGNIPPADMEPIHPTVADLSGTGAKYQVDETQSTRLRYRSLTKNKGKTSFEVEPDTEPLQLQTFADVQAFLLSEDELDKESDKEEVLAAGEDMDEDPQVAEEVRTPSPKQDQPEPSHVQESTSDSSSPDLKKFDNIIPLTERQLIKYLRKMSRVLFKYYDKNVAHIDQTDKLVETTMNTIDKSSTTIKDLYKGLNVITQLLKDINNAVKDDPATNKKIDEAIETFAKISTNTTEVLSLVKGFDFSTLQSPLKYFHAHALKQEEESAAWTKSFTNVAWNLGSRMTALEISQTALKHKVSSLRQDTSEIKSMITEIYHAFKGQSSSAPSSSVTPTLALTNIPANIKGENATNTATEEPPSHTEGETEICQAYKVTKKRELRKALEEANFIAISKPEVIQSGGKKS
ncbi:hypothetical protein Tco_0673666 [Tanacetum coccineum]